MRVVRSSVVDESVDAHHTQHQHGGSDEVATATAGANAIPKAGSAGKLARAWTDGATVSVHPFTEITARWFKLDAGVLKYSDDAGSSWNDAGSGKSAIVSTDTTQVDFEHGLCTAAT